MASEFDTPSVPHRTRPKAPSLVHSICPKPIRLALPGLLSRLRSIHDYYSSLSSLMLTSTTSTSHHNNRLPHACLRAPN